MLKFNLLKLRRCFNSGAFLLFSILTSISSSAQIFAPEGLNMPGVWNGFTNPPATGSPFGSQFQVSGGGVTLITTGQRRWTTTFTGVTMSGSNWLFTSGPTGNPYGNKWAGVNVAMNTLQSYNFNFGADNTITTNPSRHYTMNWEDQGYTGTRAIFMETDNAPVTITNVTQTPSSPVLPATPVSVTVTASSALSPQEIMYIRYTTNSFATSTLLTVPMTDAGGTQGTVNIPGQADGTIVAYYAFTSTVASITADFDLYTIRSNNNGGANYVYSVAAAPPVNVVFRVNMSNVTVNPGGVRLAGNFNGFSTTANPMTNIGGGVWETTVALNVGANITYKFVNESTFEGNLGAPCGNGSDRTYTVTGPATLPTVCFSQCANCIAPVAVKFRVNMATQNVTGGVFLAGSFNGFSTTANPMVNVSGSIWETTINLALGSYTYKFVNGSTFENNLPGPCGNGLDRVVNVTGASTLPLVCFSSCSNCPPVVQLTFRVNMSNQTVNVNGVHVAGSFNGFSTTANPMLPIGGGVYSATVIVPANSSHIYKFINGNTFAGVESVPAVCGTDDGFGGNNRNVSVTTSNRTLATVCFGQCIDCGAWNEWTGNASIPPGAGTDFGVGFNWTAGVAPSGCNSNVRIRNRPNQPIISSNFTCGNLEVQSGTILTINSGATLNACGNISGPGRVEGMGTLNLNGTAPQTISGLSTINNLRIDNSNGVSLAAGANIKISNTLKLQSGTLTTTGAILNFLASATNEARLLKIESGAGLSGNITYNSRLAPTSAGWYFLGAPVTGQVANTFAQKSNIFAAGSYDVGQSNAGSIFFYDRDASPNSNTFGWRKPASPSTGIPVGTGIRVFAKNTFMSGGGTFTFTGAIAPSPFNFGVQYCASGCTNGNSDNGFNLLSNPFPCTIDWDAPTGWTRTNIDGTLYIWNAALNNYSTYNNFIGVNGGTNLIAAGQGFMVKATNGAANMVATEDVKVNTYTAGMRTATVEPSGLKIYVASNSNSDEAWIDYSAERADMEATKLHNPVLNLSLINSGKEYAMASLGKVENNRIVELQLTGNSGQTALRFEKIGNLTQAGVYLRDNVNGQLTAIEESTLLEFTATGNDKNRFSLVFIDGITTTPTSVGNNGLTVWPNPANDFLHIGNLERNSQFVIVDISGKTQVAGTVETGNAKVSIAHLPKGAYQIKFSGNAKPVKFVKE